jgi:hypothetical protein
MGHVWSRMTHVALVDGDCRKWEIDETWMLDGGMGWDGMGKPPRGSWDAGASSSCSVMRFEEGNCAIEGLVSGAAKPQMLGLFHPLLPIVMQHRVIAIRHVFPRRQTTNTRENHQYLHVCNPTHQTPTPRHREPAATRPTQLHSISQPQPSPSISLDHATRLNSTFFKLAVHFSSPR